MKLELQNITLHEIDNLDTNIISRNSIWDGAGNIQSIEKLFATQLNSVDTKSNQVTKTLNRLRTDNEYVKKKTLNLMWNEGLKGNNPGQFNSVDSVLLNYPSTLRWNSYKVGCFASKVPVDKSKIEIDINLDTSTITISSSTEIDEIELSLFLCTGIYAFSAALEADTNTVNYVKYTLPFEETAPIPLTWFVKNISIVPIAIGTKFNGLTLNIKPTYLGTKWIWKGKIIPYLSNINTEGLPVDITWSSQGKLINKINLLNVFNFDGILPYFEGQIKCNESIYDIVIPFYSGTINYPLYLVQKKDGYSIFRNRYPVPDNRDHSSNYISLYTKQQRAIPFQYCLSKDSLLENLEWISNNGQEEVNITYPEIFSTTPYYVYVKVAGDLDTVIVSHDLSQTLRSCKWPLTPDGYISFQDSLLAFKEPCTVQLLGQLHNNKTSYGLASFPDLIIGII